MAQKAGEGRYGITRKMFLKLKNIIGLSSDNLGNGLALSSNKLVIKDGKYLGFDDAGKLDVLTGDGLKSDNAFHLTLNLGDGLEFDEDGKVKCSSSGVSSWIALSDTPTVGTSEITFPSGFNAEEILVVAKCSLTGYDVGASMVINLASLDSTTRYFDFGAGSSDAFFLRYGITDGSITLNTAKANNQSVAANVSTMVYYR